MSKIRVVHYINQFFANIGGEEKADYPAATSDGRKKIRLAMQKTKQQFREHYRKRFPESKEKFQIERNYVSVLF